MTNSFKILVLDHQREFGDYLSQLVPLLGNYELEFCSNSLSLAAKATMFDTRMIICDSEFMMQNTALFADMYQRFPNLLIVLIGNYKPKNLPPQIEFVPRPFRLIDLGERVKQVLDAEKLNPGQPEYAWLLGVKD